MSAAAASSNATSRKRPASPLESLGPDEQPVEKKAKVKASDAVSDTVCVTQVPDGWTIVVRRDLLLTKCHRMPSVFLRDPGNEPSPAYASQMLATALDPAGGNPNAFDVTERIFESPDDFNLFFGAILSPVGAGVGFGLRDDHDLSERMLRALDYFGFHGRVEQMLSEATGAAGVAGLPTETHAQRMRCYTLGVRFKNALLLRRAARAMWDTPAADLPAGAAVHLAEHWRVIGHEHQERAKKIDEALDLIRTYRNSYCGEGMDCDDDCTRWCNDVESGGGVCDAHPLVDHADTTREDYSGDAFATLRRVTATLGLDDTQPEIRK